MTIDFFLKSVKIVMMSTTEDELKEFFLNIFCEKYDHKLKYCKNTLKCALHKDKWASIKESTPDNCALKYLSVKNLLLAANNALCCFCNLPCFNDPYINEGSSVSMTVVVPNKKIFKDDIAVAYLAHHFCQQKKKDIFPLQHPKFQSRVIFPLEKCMLRIINEGPKHIPINWRNEWTFLKNNLTNIGVLIDRSTRRKCTQWR